MLRLLTFGGLRVLRDDGSATDLANQRRRIAVLAVVAAAAPGGVTRERLLFLLWPDADDDKGRHALNQIVYNLRRELGASPIDGVSELSLLPEVMSADLLDFRTAIAKGDHAAAAELYVGPFLDGFFVPGAGEFDRWAEDERVRTLRQAVSSIEKLAAVAEAARDREALVRWTRRLVELDPLSARRALAHMRALEAEGDRDAAIAYGRRYDVLARADGDDVDPAVAAEVERLRAMPTLMPPISPAAEPTMAPVTAHPVSVMTSAAEIGAGEEADGEAKFDLRANAATPESTESATRPKRRRWLPAAIAAGLMIAGVAAWQRGQRHALPLGAGDRMLIADVQLPTADTASARGLAFALQSALQQSARVQLVSPAAVSDALQRMGRSSPNIELPDSVALEVAEREGARYVASLSIMTSGSSQLLTLRILDPTRRSTLRTYTATAPGDNVLAAIDDVAAMVRRDLGDSDSDIAAAVPLPRATTPSLEALRLLAGGRRAFARSLYNDARTLYDGAIALDSGFAAAHAGLAAIEYYSNNIPAGDAHIARALALSDRLPPRERMLIEAQEARGRADWGRAATLHRAYLIRFPEDYDSYQMLGYDLFMGRNYTEALEAYDTLLAHRKADANALFNIGQINGSLERYAAARMAHVAALHLDTAMLLRNIPNEQFGATLMRLGFPDSARAVFNVMLTRNAADQARGHRSLAYVDLYDGRYDDGVQHLRRAIEIAQSVRGTTLSQIRDRALLASTLIELGKADEARTELRAAAALAFAGPHDPRVLLWTGKPAIRLGDTLMGRQLLDSARARTRDTDREQVSATLGLEAELQMARHQYDDGVATARRAIAAGNVPYLTETLAYGLERAGKLAEAREQHANLARTGLTVIGREGQQVARLAPLAVARLDALLGRDADARKQIAAFIEQWPRADKNLVMLAAPRARLDAAPRR